MTEELNQADLYSKLLPKCKEMYQDAINEFKEDEKYYELNFKELLELPEEYKKEGIILPTARDMVDTFVDHIDISNARVFVNKKGDSKKDAEEAEMLKKIALGIIHRNNVESDISPWRVSAKYYALHGLVPVETLWNADAQMDKPDRLPDESESDYTLRVDEWMSKKDFSFPLLIRACNPAIIIPDPYYGGRGFYFKIEEKVCMDIQRKNDKWSNPKGKQISDNVEKVSYWDDTYRCEWADGEPLKQVKNGIWTHNYGFLPCVFMDSGLGNISIGNELKMRYVGVLRYIRNLLVSESRSYSISDIILKREAYPTKDIIGKNSSEVTEYSQKYGDVNRLPEGIQVQERQHPMPPDALNAHMYRTADMIAAHAAPRSVRGLGETGVRSGADRRLVIAEASARYRYSEDAFRNGTAKILSNCVRLIKNVIPNDIRVWSHTPTDEFDVYIDRNKITEPFNFYVEFAPMSEEDEYRRHDDLERLVSSGIVSRPWARKKMSNVDPASEEREEEKQKLMNDPQIQAIISQYAQGKLAKAISMRESAEGVNNLPQMGQGTPMGAAGMPPMGAGLPQAGRAMVPQVPNVAPLGSAQDLQNQLKQNRSQISQSPTQGIGINAGGNKP